MTLQDLKENRTGIISTLTEKVGEENIKEVMNIMIKGVDCCDSIEELIEGSLSIFEQQQNKSRRKVSKTAEMIGRYEAENNIHYDVRKKVFVKDIH